MRDAPKPANYWAMVEAARTGDSVRIGIERAKYAAQCRDAETAIDYTQPRHPRDDADSEMPLGGPVRQSERLSSRVHSDSQSAAYDRPVRTAETAPPNEHAD